MEKRRGVSGNAPNRRKSLTKSVIQGEGLHEKTVFSAALIVYSKGYGFYNESGYPPGTWRHTMKVHPRKTGGAERGKHVIRGKESD